MQINNDNTSMTFGRIRDIGKVLGRAKKSKTMQPISHKFKKMEKRLKTEIKTTYSNCSTKLSDELKNISDKFLDLLI